MKLKDRDTYVLDSGREIYANCGIIGLTADADELDTIYDGYDGSIFHHRYWGAGGDLTDAERREIAMFMVDLWCRYIARIPLLVPKVEP